MQSIKHFGLAKLLLLLLLTQHAVAAVAMSDGGMYAVNTEMAEMTAMMDGAHDCGDAGMAGMTHANSDQLHQDHQQCIDSGCTDCVASVAATVCSNLPVAVSLHGSLNVHWSSRLLVTAQPETLYRPPIQN